MRSAQTPYGASRDENHFGQVIQHALTTIPTTAIPHTTASSVYPISQIVMHKSIDVAYDT